MIAYNLLDVKNYVSALVDVISKQEGHLAVVTDLGDGKSTIGYGYTFERNNNLDIWRAAGIILSEAEINLLKSIDSSAGSQKTVIALGQFHRVLTAQEAKMLLGEIYIQYESPALALAMPESWERVALVSVTYNRGVGTVYKKMGEFLQAFESGDRAEAWFQMRYNSQTNNPKFEDGIAKRRYYEADIFGLYNDAGNVTESEAKQVLQMYTRHRDKIADYEARFGIGLDGQVGVRNNIAAANQDFASVFDPVDTLADALTPAQDLFVYNYVTNNGYTVEINGEVLLGDFWIDLRDRLIARELVDSNYLPGNDLFIGGQGNDVFSSGRGDDVLFGESESDTLVGGKGNDTLVGGTGTDTYIWDTGDGNDSILDEGGQGRLLINDNIIGAAYLKTDTYSVYESARGDIITLDTSSNTLTIVLKEGGTLTIQNFNKADQTLGIDLQDKVQAYNGSDTNTVFFDYFAQVASGALDLKIPTPHAVTNAFVLDPAVGTMTATAQNDSVVGRGSDKIDGISGGAGDDILFADEFIADLHAYLNADSGQLGPTGLRSAVARVSAVNLEVLTVNDLHGDAGEDLLVGGFSSDQLWGGADADILIGGEGADLMGGDQGGDSSYPDDGNDQIFAGAGDDELQGNGGEDLLYGGSGADKLWGNAGRDKLLGGYGMDTLAGDDGGIGDHDTDAADELYGEGGDDELFGNGGDDDLHGGDGNDSLMGNSGADYLFGGSGDDGLAGESIYETTAGMNYDDYLDGGAGNDTLRGMNGNDYLWGSDGNDVIVGDDGPMSAALQGADTLSGGNGDDTLYGQGYDDVLDGGDGADRLYGDGAVTPAAIHGADALDGGAGSDLLYGQGGDDWLTGGAGLDELFGGAGSDQLDGSDGNDLLVGDYEEDQGDDLLSGGAGDDQIYGGAGNDTLTGGSGIDLLAGGEGDDVYTDLRGEDFIADNQGHDRVMLDGASGVAASDALGLTGTTLNILLDDGEILHIGDALFGSNLTLEFGNGSTSDLETLVGTTLQSSVSLRLGDGGGSVYGGARADALYGGAGNDRLSGALGGDFLSGGAGNDRLDGNGGADMMLGGAGNDTYVVDVGRDAIAEKANEGCDTVESSVTRRLDINLENLTLTGFNAINGIGNALDNLLLGNGGANILYGAVGSDVLQGAAGADKLIGGAGADVFDYRGFANWASDAVQDTVLDLGTATGSPGNAVALDNAVDLSAISGDVLLVNWNDLAGLTGFDSGSFAHPGAGSYSTLAAADLASNASGTADAAHAQFVYKTGSGLLSFDPDGTGNAASVSVTLIGATSHPTLTAAEIVVVG